MQNIYKIPWVNDQQSTNTNIVPTADTANNSIVNWNSPTNSPSSNINNVINWQSYTNTSSTTTNAWAPTNGAPVVSGATVSTTPWEASSWWQPDATATALAWQKAVITSQQNDLNSNKNADIVAQANDNAKYLADIQKAKDEQIKAQEDTNKQIDALQKAEEARAKSIVDQQNQQLLDEKIASVNDLEASKAQQKLTDEQNIKNQEINNNILQQKSAWAFNKLGLSFSWWAIEQATQIAQNWAYSLAKAQSDLVKNQTSIEKDIIKAKNDYSTLINDNINKYNDLMAKYKEDAINRINSLTLNKIKTSEEVLKEKKTTADEFRKTVSDLEKQFKADQQTLADEAVKNAENIRLNSERIKTEKMTALEWQLTSGNLNRMTPEQISQMETELWQPQWFIKAKMNEWISKTIRWELDKLVWTDYFPNNMNSLIAKVKEQMSQWRDLTASINYVIANEKKTNPEIQKAIEEKKAKENLDAEKLQLERDKFDYQQSTTNFELNQEYGTDFNITAWPWNTRADRNNNPWNLRVEGTNWKDSGWFGIFNTPEEWFNAMVKDVSAKVNWWSRYSWQIKTLKDLISVYAPAWDGNNPNSYSAIVAKALWISVDAPIGSLKWREAELATAMAKHEWWTGSVTNKTAPTTEDLSTKSISQLRQIALANWVDNVNNYKWDEGKTQLMNVINSTIEGNRQKAEINKAKESETNITKLKEKVKSWDKLDIDLLEKDLVAFKPEINDLKWYVSWIKSIADRTLTALNPMNALRGWSKQDLNTKTFWDQNRDVEKIKSIISSIEDSITTADTKWDVETMKEIRRRYLAPMLKSKWIQYDEKKWKFYIDQTIWDFYL